MNKMMKTLCAMALVGALALTGCGNTQKAKTKEATDMKTVAISQFANHGSLDNCREGFLQGLAEGGYTEGKNLKVVYQNAQADTSIANQIANQFVGDKPDLLCGIATPAAQALYNAGRKAHIPVIYTAISNPVMAGLADESGKGSGGVTGTSDELPLEAQVKMIRALMPEAKTIGVLYTTSEVNSLSNIERLKTICPQYGFHLEAVGVSTVQDIPQALDNLLGKVDCLNNLTDNTVVNSLDLVLDKAKNKGIPVFGSEIEQVKKGCVAAINLDYVALGKATGLMAAKILNGEDIDAMHFETFKDGKMVYNAQALEQYKLKLAQDMQAEAV